MLCSASRFRRPLEQLPQVRHHGRAERRFTSTSNALQRRLVRHYLCTGWHPGPQALPPSLGTSGAATRVRLGQMTVTSFAWDRCKKDRNDSFYNLPPPNSLNRGGVAILTPLCGQLPLGRRAGGRELKRLQRPMSGDGRPICAALWLPRAATDGPRAADGGFEPVRRLTVMLRHWLSRPRTQRPVPLAGLAVFGARIRAR